MDPRLSSSWSSQAQPDSPRAHCPFIQSHASSQSLPKTSCGWAQVSSNLNGEVHRLKSGKCLNEQHFILNLQSLVILQPSEEAQEARGGAPAPLTLHPSAAQPSSPRAWAFSRLLPPNLQTICCLQSEPPGKQKVSLDNT